MRYADNSKCIRKAVFEDVEAIWSVMEKVHQRQNQFIRFEDIDEKHTKESLKEILEKENVYESIWVFCENDKIVGLIDVEYKNADYLFFDDKYVYIKYFYVKDNKKEISEQLMDIVLEKAKQYDFHYICGDVLPEDNMQTELYEQNQLEYFRIRLAKKLM